MTSEMFARHHPDRVAGMVWVDAVSSGSLAAMLPYVTRVNTAAVCFTPALARIGLLRLFDPMRLRQFPADADRAEALLYRPEPMATICGLARGATASADQFQRAPALDPAIRLTVLSAENGGGLLPSGLPAFVGPSPEVLLHERQQLQEQFAAQFTRATWRIVPGSDHLIGNSRPHEAAQAVIEMVTRSRHEPWPPR
jgi:hypothetical protein